MKRLLAPLLLLFVLFMPFAVSAQSNLPLFDPDWQLVPDAHKIDPENCPEGYPLGFAGVLQLIQNGMNAAISFGVIIFVLVIAGAGILWILTPTNPENHSQAKKILTNAVIGLLIILSAWLIVDFVMKLLYNPSARNFGPWNQILTGGDLCIKPMENLQPLFSGNIVAVPGRGNAPSGVAGGSCVVPTIDSHPCSIASLSGTCFAASGASASQVCNKESGGRSVRSGSDKLNNGSGPSYSWGLWQINLTTTDTQAAGWGMDCRDAFSNRCQGDALKNQRKVGWCNSRVINPELFARCTEAALDPVKNTRAACGLYTSNLGAWACSAQRCGVPNARRVNHPSCAYGR